jgi:hypothetical protein
MTNYLNENSKRVIKRIVNIVSITLIVIVGVMLESKISEHLNKKEVETAAVRCPSLFSISRSARDTLIVMRVEPICRPFLLETMK